MGKPTGFMEIKREKPAERDPLTRLKDWKEYSAPFSEEASKRQGARCMDCGTPFCQIGADINGFTSGCPIYNLIPEWNDLVYRGRWKEALERLMKTNNFPEFTGRVCPAPCEGSCTLAISDPVPFQLKISSEPLSTKDLRTAGFNLEFLKNEQAKKWSIVGSGPAGLASADQLNQAGHSVTVFERADRAGGLLTYGIPNMKLEKGIVERRIKLLTQEGIDFVTNTEIGVDITADELKEQFDAVILCTGAQKQRDLLIEGRDSKGVHYAMDYLTLATKSYLDSNFKDKQFIDAKGKDVIVIGGGDTGADCVATALRQKAKSVHQFGKHPKLPPARTNDNMWY
nr:glutamate synthase small subunit [Bacillus subtilis]